MGGSYQPEVLVGVRQYPSGPPSGAGHLPHHSADECAGKEVLLFLALSVGTLSEGAYKLGIRVFGRNFFIWRWLDIPLRGFKYLLLFLFVRIILIDMPNEALAGFLDAPYWAVSDIKMFQFFTRMTTTTAVLLLILAGLSLFYKNFWCRYLCPYGALLGLASMISPFKIRRDPVACTGCRRCTTACPSRLEVHTCFSIASPECTGCLTCVEHCPEQTALAMQPAFWQKQLPVWVFPVMALSLFMAAIAVGIVSGHWYSFLSYEDYQHNFCRSYRI